MSVFFAISPPRASISRTTIPFAGPPIDGLQGASAMFFMFPVIKRVLLFSLADASAASHPACPPPTTIMSYFIFISPLFMRLYCSIFFVFKQEKKSYLI